LESLVTSEWQKTGFACKPLQKTTLHGLSTDWSFDECLANVIAPDTTNVKAATKHANAVHYDYNFATDGDSNKGVVSVYDIAYATSVLQKTTQATEDWKRDGYSCYPEPPYDNDYKLGYNVSECADVFLSPSSETILQGLYFPFGTSEYSTGGSGVCGSGMYSGCASKYPDTPYGSSVAVLTRLSAIYSYKCGKVDLPSGAAYGGYVTGQYVPNACTCYNSDCTSYSSGSTSSITVTEIIAGWNEILSTPADAYGNFGSDVICSKFKRNGNGFRCFDKPKPPSTKELAIQRYASEYPPATICAPLKLNSPFQCTRNVEVPATTRLSLSVAAAQAVFAVSGIILVALLRKLRTPPKSKESLSGDDDIRSVVRKLRITVDKLSSGQDKLSTEFRTGHGEHEELIQKLLSK